MQKYVKMLKELASTVKEYVSKAIDPIQNRLNVIEEKIAKVSEKELPIDDIAIQAALLIEKPKDGKDADPELIKKAVKDEVFSVFSEIELPKDGKNIEPEEARKIILDELAKVELPKGEKGDKGDVGLQGEIGPQGERGEAGLDGLNGKSAYEIAQEKGFAGSELDWLSSLKGEKGINGKDGRDGRDGKDGLAGRDGENGKDALQIEILPLIDESKTYPRGSYASHNGGLWHAVKNTQGMDGWSCLVDGIKGININFDGERGVTVEITKSSTQTIAKSFNMPAMIYKGIYSASTEYQTGDTVTWGGSLWYCQEPTTDKPMESKAWILCAKKGRDGKDGEKGEKGDKGRDGKDLMGDNRAKFN